MHMIVVVFIMGIIVILSNTKNPNEKEVKGTVIGFENTPGQWYPGISPIISYEVNGKTYRCVMFTLQCEDTSQNRLLYINKEYTLYYYEKYPNRVRTGTSVRNNTIILLMMIFMMIMLLVVTVGI